MIKWCFQFLFSFILLANFFAQENPWELPKINPWTNETIVKPQYNNNTKISYIDLNQISNKQLKKMAYDSLEFKNPFLYGFACGAILNFYGTIPYLFGSLIRSKNESNMMYDFDATYPNASKKQRKVYNSGITSKRFSSGGLGLLTGMATQIAIILLILLYY